MRELLIKGAAQLGLMIEPEPYLSFVALLEKWNDAYNLTAIRDPKEMLTKHLLDSLTLVPFIQGEHVLDIGSGAGLPGIPLALYFPQKSFVLLDSRGKKVRFLEMVVRQLKLSNVKVVQKRAEDYQPSEPFDTVTARGLGSLKQFVSWTKVYVASGGIWLAMKGREPKEELAELNESYTVHQLHVPGLDEERCVVCIRKG